MAVAAILKNHKNRDISATVWPISTQFGSLMQNGPFNLSDRYRIWISQIQDGGRPPFWKPLNCLIFATVLPILMKFSMVTHTTYYGWRIVIISNFWKSKMAAAAVLKITKIAISPQRFDRSLQNLVRWCKVGLFTAPTIKNLNFTDSRWRTAAMCTAGRPATF